VKIWIFQTGEPLHIDGNSRPMRAMNLSDSLIKAGHEVTIWSSKFDHQKKVHRDYSNDTIISKDGLRTILVSSPGYKSHIGLKRLYDHSILGLNLKKKLEALNDNELPDLIFIGYPPIEFAFVASRYAARHSIPYFIDVKDQWPEIFLRAFPFSAQKFLRVLLFPYFSMGVYAIKNASCLVSMTDAFANWAEKYSGRSTDSRRYILPLAPMSHVGELSDNALDSAADLLTSKGIAATSANNVFFVGTFMRSAFDFNPIIVAAQTALDKGLDWRFLLCGDGDALEEVVFAAKSLPNIVFLGRVNRSQMIAIAKLCKLGIAPIKNNPDYLLSIPNKLVDYFSLGLPVLTSLKGEAECLIKKWKVGAVYSDDNENDLFLKLEFYFNNPSITSELSKNSEMLFSTEFDGDKLYSQFARKIIDYV
jgi:glycosyltransferase involved in cell wall biosynthesis